MPAAAIIGFLPMQTLTSYLRRTASRCLMPLAARAANVYVAGPELEDALRVAFQLTQRGFATTLGFWDGAGDSPAGVADAYQAALEALSIRNHDGYLSIKLPALGGAQELLAGVLKCAAESGLRIHFDSLAPEDADAMWAAAVAAASRENVTISCSIPGRWRRSVNDADIAIATGIIPRVVKGQWADPAFDEMDLRRSFLNIVERLAGRVPHVAVASHDGPLVRDAIRCLRASGTNCELELLYGLPERDVLAVAKREGVPVRFYVPYGKAYLPYCLGQARRQPRLLWWLMRDALLRPRRFFPAQSRPQLDSELSQREVADVGV
jgi:proline dehydrogenase